MSTTPDTEAETFAEELQAIDVRLNAQDFESVLMLSLDFLKKTAHDDSVPTVAARVKCLRKTGEAQHGLRQYEDSLESYEQARLLAETQMDVCATEAMDILFSEERTLNALAMLDKLGSAEAELKNALISQYLLGTDTSGNAEANGIVDQNLLDKLYSTTLKSMEQKTEEKQKSEFMYQLELLLKNKTVSAVINQSMVWLTVVLVLVGGIKVAQYAMDAHLSDSERPEAALQKIYTSVAHATATKANELLAFKSSDGYETLSLNKNDRARYLSADEKFSGRFMFYDGSMASSLMTIICSNLGPSCTFQCRGATIVSQMGTVFFNRQDNGFKLIEEMNQITQNLDVYLKTKHSIPDQNAREWTYFNPDTKRHAKVIRQSILDTEQKYEPGSIILVTGFGSPSEFRLFGCDNRGQLLPVERNAKRWQSTLPAVAPPATNKNTEILFIFCERPFNTAMDFLRTRLWVTLAVSVLLMLAAGSGVKVLIGQAEAKLRTRRSQKQNTIKKALK